MKIRQGQKIKLRGWIVSIMSIHKKDDKVVVIAHNPTTKKSYIDEWTLSSLLRNKSYKILN